MGYGIWDMGYGIWHIDMVIYHIDMVILDIDMGYVLMIWEMIVSIWSSCVSIWDIMSLCLRIGLIVVRVVAAQVEIGRFWYVAWAKCPYRVADKASALRAGKRAPG